MILVDTSVLIDYLREVSNSATDRMDAIIKQEIPYGINNHIYQEVLQGTATEKDFKSLQEYLSTQKFYNLLHETVSHESAASLYFKCRKKGLNVRSTIDFLIVQTAIENNLLLLHNDADFTSISRIINELRIY